MTHVPTEPLYFPGPTWRRSLPEAQGIDSSRLVTLFEAFRREQTNINSLLIIRNGFLVLESYFSPHSRTTLHDVASVTKSVTSMLVGSAIQHGILENVEQQIAQLLPEFDQLAPDDEARSLTIKHLLTMTAGLNWNESLVPYTSLQNDLTQMHNQTDWLQFWATRSRGASPGQQFNYNSGGYHVLAAALQAQTGVTLAEFAKKHLFAPLGIDAYQWPADLHGVTQGSSHLCVTANALARLGYLMLNAGSWNGEQLLPQAYVETATRRATDIFDATSDHRPNRSLLRIGRQRNELPPYGGYGYGWYLPSFGGFAARGFGGQAIFVLPVEQLIVVFTAHLDRRRPFLPEYLMREYILSALLPVEENRSVSQTADGPRAAQTLQQTIDALANPLPIRPTVQDAIAPMVTRRVYICKPNRSGVQCFRFIFDDEADAILEVTIAGRVHHFRLGLDFTFRLNPMPDGDIVGGRASWVARRRFVVETQSTRTGGIFRMLFSFRNNRAVLFTQEGSSKKRERIIGTRDDSALIDCSKPSKQ